MSQQTQIERIVLKYEQWISRFPTIEAVAKAPVSEILILWSGLGYNRRALHLKKTAETVVSNYKGIFPGEESVLLSLPGIGVYTARAILCFAFDKQITVIDTNVRRVITANFLKNSHDNNEYSSQKSPQNDVLIKNIAEQLLPIGKAYIWNQALMDYAAIELKNEKMMLPKQSKFLGSHRYYRGQIIKQLVQKKHIPLPTLGPLIKKEYKPSDKQWLIGLISELQNEGFLQIQQENIRLQE
jgi:A/G-specific adenine glycosylase